MEQMAVSDNKGHYKAAATSRAAENCSAKPASEQQILADYTSMQTKFPARFWRELKAQKLIEPVRPYRIDMGRAHFSSNHRQTRKTIGDVHDSRADTFSNRRWRAHHRW